MSKFDIHIHSCYSNNLYGTVLLSPPSKSLPEDIIKTAIERGLNVIAVTDHDNVMGGKRAAEIADKKYKGKILVIPGVEVSSKDGHIIGLNVHTNIPKNLPAEETVALIKKQGGYAIIAHPLNIKYSLSKEKLDKVRGEILAVEAANSHSLKNKHTQEYAREHGVSMSAGSDAHSLSEIGLCYGETEGDVKTFEDFIKAIESKSVKVHAYNGKLLRRVIPGALKAFFYWKGQQIKHIFKKDTFLPYLDK